MRIIFLWCFLIFCACSSAPKYAFIAPKNMEELDYSSLDNWASHPVKLDAADHLPAVEEIASQEDMAADVFFIHPTTFTGRRGENQWNASLEDEELNERTDQSTIRFQASIFNRAGRVFAPRYRQAHLHAFYTDDRRSAKAALEVAYQDVARAFEYYLENNNEGRPIVLAAHSQGTLHGTRLVKTFFDNSPLAKQLVVAYLVGMPVRKGYFKNIPPCDDRLQTNCYCSWRTYRKDYIPDRHPVGDSILVTNPLNWKTTDEYASKELNKGAVLRNFDKVYEELVDAYVHDGMLWVSRPKFPWSFLFTRKNYHIADYNFFYFNVQDNAIDRVDAFMK